MVEEVSFPEPAKIKVCFDRQKKDIPNCIVRIEIYLKGYKPYIYDLLIIKSVDVLHDDSSRNGLSKCEIDYIHSPRIREPDRHTALNVERINRYKALKDGKIDKVIVQIRDKYDYSQIYASKVFKEF